ncbi:MAG: hypothetical protein JW982_10735 [Spirochaetes bacterium]|nr:hypothetical protein [Spirochaetota bacterium]
MKLIIIIILCLIILILILVPAYFGMFTKVKFSEEMSGVFTIVYKPVKGDYRKSGAVMDDVFNFLKNQMKIETTKGFGYYFDDPQKTNKDELRSIAGCVVDKNINKSEIEKAGYKTDFIENNQAYVTTFPYKSKLSVVFSLFKVYPALAVRMSADKKENLPVIEIYDIPEKKIRYIIFKDISREKIISRYYE